MSIIKKLILIVVAIAFVQCSNNDKYLIAKGQVGFLTNETTLNTIGDLYEDDSLVNLNIDTTKTYLANSNRELIVYAKGGKKMLEIIPEDGNDENSKIKSIQIFDKNFHTDKGISLKSTFKDINENYMVDKVETTLTSATLFIDELNATIAIDKKELGLNTFSREEIRLEQIPDMAKIKFFTIWLN